MTARLDWFGHEFLSVEMLNGFEMYWDIPRLCWTVKDLLVPRNVAPSRFSQDLKKEWSNKDAYACTILLILLTASNPHIIGLGASVNLSDPVRFHSMSQLQPSVSSTYCTVKAISERLCSTTDGKARHTKEIQKKNRSHRDHTKYHEQVLLSWFAFTSSKVDIVLRFDPISTVLTFHCKIIQNRKNMKE